jgi:exopolyphosphatase/guanosine-5'-triphosphate,3'-diphosphate pyrophosphatase
MFCRTDPLSAEDEAALRAHLSQELHRAMDEARLPPCATVVGSAGTIGALANFIRRRPSAERRLARLRSNFSVEDLGQASAELRAMTLPQRQATPGIEERRSEIIVAGAVILEEICGYLGARGIRTVRRGLRDGLMLEEVERLGLSSRARR